MKASLQTLAVTFASILLLSPVQAQKIEPTIELRETIQSCQNVQRVLANADIEPHLASDDDFRTAGAKCGRLGAAFRNSDTAGVHLEIAGLRELFARLGMPPATAEEQLVAAEAKAEKLVEKDLFYALDDLAPRALETGQIEKAENYARRLLEMAPSYSDNWNYGNAVFRGNVVLGRIALRQGDIAQAEAHLLAAGGTTGSPQLNEFGPNMTLAKELLEGKHSEAVLKFFLLCKKFWQKDEGKLDRWSTEVQAGRIPEFGANLRVSK